MWTPCFLTVFALMQAVGEGPPQGPRDGLEAVLERASKESVLNRAGSILWSYLADEAAIRSALLSSLVMDERSAYILFRGHWGAHARIPVKSRPHWQRIVVDAVATKPMLIRSVIRADRYDIYLRSRPPRADSYDFYYFRIDSPIGAPTINNIPFFQHSPDADDLVKTFIEALRKETKRPAKATRWGECVLATADEMEVHLLSVWQMLCGVCVRLDLIDKATTKNWRDRFPELDRWFQENRPFVLWDDIRSCMRIDEDAQELGRPTPRTSRCVPELRPPWLSKTR
jgi:hypothetical protein